MLMNRKFNVACVQNCAGPDLEANVTTAVELVRKAHGAGADLVCLPEFFSCLELREDGLFVGAWQEPEHPALPRFRTLAAELEVWVLLGSLAVEVGSTKLRNRSYVLDATGGIVTHYDKIHLFDVDLSSRESYRESDRFEPGGEAVVSPTPWGQMGLSVCYDLRFAQLYRALAQAGAYFLTVPAAFTKTTGQAHWHTLLRARAIETGSYVFAPCQYGTHGKGTTYGHSLIVDPWGEVLADAGDGPGFALAEVDPKRVEEVRAMIPALRHDRDFLEPGRSAVTVRHASV